LLQRGQTQAVVHFAAETHVDRSIESPEAFVQNNVVGTCRLLEAACGYWRRLDAGPAAAFRLLHVSTDEVFGSLGPSGRFSETTPYDPSSPYSASKAASDHFVRAFHRTFGLPVLLTHCSNNFGPFQFPEKLIPLMILNAIEGRPLPVYGDGLQVRDWLHVEDHCRALRLVLSRGAVGQSYNIGGDCERTNLDVVRAICRGVDRQLPQLPDGPREQLIQFVADRPGHDRRYAMDTAKLRALGWSGAGQLEQRLDETIAWYAHNRQWVEATGAAHRTRRGLA
jgi:dTDP-glucose 4,6-dehydratase